MRPRCRMSDRLRSLHGRPPPRGYDGIPFLRNGDERFRLQLPEHRFPLLGEDAGDALPGSLLHQTVGIGESVSEGPCHAPAR